MNKQADNAQLAATARMFSTTVLQQLARSGYSSTLKRLLLESDLPDELRPSDTLRTCFDAAFVRLKKRSYRYEYAYKAAIANKLLLGVHSLNTASMLTEFRVGTSKADVVILNGTSTVYEIKSERDNLDRLANQISNYFNVFAKVNVITAETHLQDVLDRVPEQVGVVILNDRFRISTVREAQEYTKDLCASVVLDSLQQQEAYEVLRHFGYARPDVPNTQMRAVLNKIFGELAPAELHKCMIDVLKKNRSLLPLSELMRALPDSLKPLALSSGLRPRDHHRLLGALELPIAEALTWV